MLFGRNLQLQLVKPGKNGESTQSNINLENIDYDKLGQIARDTVKVAAISVLGVGVAFFALSTVKQVVVNLTNPANYK